MSKIKVLEKCWKCGKEDETVEQNICDKCQAEANMLIEEMMKAARKGDQQEVQRLLALHAQTRKRLILG